MGFLRALGGAFRTVGRGFRRFGRGFRTFAEEGGLEQFDFRLSSSFEGGPQQIGTPLDPRTPYALLPPSRVAPALEGLPVRARRVAEPALPIVEPSATPEPLFLIGVGMGFTLFVLLVARLAAR